MISIWWFAFFAVTTYLTAYRHGESNALYKLNRSQRWHFNRKDTEDENHR